MKINVKSLQGDEYSVDVQNDQLVSDLKVFISEKANGPAISRQKLVYKGRTMQDSSVVGEYNLEEGCKVHLILQKEASSSVGGAVHSQASSSSTVSSSTSTSTSTTTTNVPSSSSTTRSQPMETTLDRPQSGANMTTATSTPYSDPNREQSRFEIILRERLAQYMSPDDVERIMVNLHHEINADINSSSLDDLERLAKQKLNISNE